MPEREDENIPNILEEIKNAPIAKKFLEQRKIFLWGPVMDDSAKEIVSKLESSYDLAYGELEKMEEESLKTMQQDEE